MTNNFNILIISLLFNPSSWVSPEEELPCLIITEDEDGERNGWQPPVEVERVHPEPLVHARAV